MLFDPDDGKTWPQKIEAVLDRMPPVYRETVTDLAQLRGCSVQDIVEECVHLWLDDMEDPKYREAQRTKTERQEAPFGRDPRFKKDA